jgi:hypothetical protein
MIFLPRTTMGRRALWLLIPVLLFPLYWSVLLLVPDSWRGASIAAGVAIIGLAVVSLVAAGVAVFREGERSVLLVALASLTFVGVVVFAVGEALGGH